MNQIIDYERKGNVVRFYLGENGCQWGDDWNDYPYECNAGKVYDEYVRNYIDVVFEFDNLVLEPCDGTFDSGFCKKDMIQRRVPCIIVVPKELHENTWCDTFDHWVGCAEVKKYYFGDVIDG